MKIKILSSAMKTYWYSDRIGDELYVDYNVESVGNPFIYTKNHHYIRSCDSVITELPKSFCVKRCDDNKKWYKYLEWLVKEMNYSISMFGRVFVGVLDGVIGKKLHYNDLYPFGTEIHIDDMIKHIDYVESQQHIKGGEQFHKESQLTVKMDKIIKEEEFDLTTLQGRIYHTKKHYPIGTKYIPLNSNGIPFDSIKKIDYPPKYIASYIEGGFGYIYANGKWAEIIKEETNMDTQKLSRQGLKEIHSVACSTWKILLEQYGSRNPLEDYIELSQEEVNQMFVACSKDQLPIVSKYLKKEDDGSIDVTKFNVNGKGFYDSALYVIRDREMGKYSKKSFLLGHQYNWEIKEDEIGELCLIPTKKK